MLNFDTWWTLLNSSMIQMSSGVHYAMKRKFLFTPYITFAAALRREWRCLGLFKDERNLKNYFLVLHLFFRISRV